MNLSYAIFRSQPIMTTGDLSQIGAHNKREKKAYKSNPDINVELSSNNIELVPLKEKYLKGFDNLTKEYKKEYEERMKTQRKSRQKQYHEMLNSSRNCVADELLFTASADFFKDMDREDIKKWADTCMEFVYKDLGYKKEQILHSVVHLDEKTPHIHCVVIPLVKKLDNRTKTERYTISKKQYIKNQLHLSELQDKYHKRLTDACYDLERGIKGSDNKHIKIKEYKRITKKINQDLNIRNDKLDKAVNDFEKNMKTSKNTIFDKEYVKVKKETFDSMNNVIEESKKVMELQPKLEKVFNEIDSYANSYNSLDKENQKHIKEIKVLTNINQNLEKENYNLKERLKAILRQIKRFFRTLLQIGNEPTKDTTSKEIKDYYNNKEFDMEDVVGISRGTIKEDELFDYVNAPNYIKTRNKSYDDNYKKNKNDFEISL